MKKRIIIWALLIALIASVTCNIHLNKRVSDLEAFKTSSDNVIDIVNKKLLNISSK